MSDKFWKDFREGFSSVITRRTSIAILAASLTLYICAPLIAQQAPPNPAVASSQGQPVIFSPQNLNVAPYPLGAVPVQNFGQGSTANVTATLPAVAGKTTYICGLSDTSNATAASTGGGSVAAPTGLFVWLQPTAVGPQVGQFQQTFSPCLPALAPNTAIVITGPAAGAGGSQDVSAWGYQL